jgi:hypothetical protein
MRRAVVLAFFISFAFCQSQAVAADITGSVKVTEQPPGSGNFLIQATGNLSLAAGETFTNIQFAFTNPTGNQIPPFVNFTPPAPGNTSPYTGQISNTTKGNWIWSVSMNYTDAKGNPSNLTKTFPFTVP